MQTRILSFEMGWLQFLATRFRWLVRKRYECPVCAYRGPFEDLLSRTGVRRDAKCPQCGALERHRLQYLVVHSVLAGLPVAQMAMLHVAPEPFMTEVFSTLFGCYETADLSMEGVDHTVDLQSLPFAAATYDIVFASHVLEHVPDDRKALEEIRRILKPCGLAILPVPLIAETTVEYAEPNPLEHYHVRAPGQDYFARYAPYFSRIVLYASDAFPEKYQLYVYEDRSRWGSRNKGNRHRDVVPVCYV